MEENRLLSVDEVAIYLMIPKSTLYKMCSERGIAQKAIAAVARKLAIILWRLYVEERPYRPAVI